MSRPHIEFIQSQSISGRTLQIDGFGKELKSRMLSRDESSGATTEIISLSEGWEAPAGFFAADLELFILSGCLQIGNYRLDKHSYSFIPANNPCGPWQALEDTDILWMPSGSVHYSQQLNTPTASRSLDYIACIQTSAIPWGTTITPGFPPGAMRKQLRIDPATGASTWLLGVLPQWQENRVEIHPVAEEALVISGAITSERGKMDQGCYFWRPPDIPHGPMSTDDGVFIFFRTDGPLKTLYSWPPNHEAG